ncbi:MAG: hypothetical protein AAFX94_22490 [Myxococcota bacterium]
MRSAHVVVFLFLGGVPVSAAAEATAKGQDEGRCRIAAGIFTSEPREPCTSPVGICTVGKLRGTLRADYAFTMATLVPAGDPTVPNLFFYTGLSEIDLRRGSLVGTDTGSFDLDPLGEGRFVSLITITDGTDAWAGAKGTLQIRGRLDFGTGMARGDYFGRVCVP